MPVTQTMANITNITYTGASANTWRVNVDALTDTWYTLGYYVHGTGFTDGSALGSAGAVKLEFLDNGSTLDIAAHETLTITDTEGAKTVYLPAINTDSTTYYLDTKGVLYDDIDLTSPVSPFSTITNETITNTESDLGANTYTEEALTLAETTREESEESFEEELTLTETIYNASPRYENEYVKITEQTRGFIASWDYVDQPSDSWSEI